MNGPEELLAKNIAELSKNGFEIFPVTLTNQGRTLEEKREENELFEKWISEKESEGWERDGMVIQMNATTKTQLMKKKNNGNLTFHI